MVLETLLGKLRAQGAALQRLTDAVEPLTAASVAGRVHLLEGRFESVFGKPGEETRTSPFRQQGVDDRVAAVEQLAADLHDAVRDVQQQCGQARASRPAAATA